MKILLTGATGFIGRHAAGALAARGASLRCLVRPGSDRAALRGLPEGAAEFVEGDLERPESLRPAVEGCAAVLHLAAETNPLRTGRLEPVNAKGSAALARLAAEAGVERFAYLSVLGKFRPWAGLALSKRRGEELVRKAFPKAIILRSAPAFGPGDRLATVLMALGARRWPLSLFPGQGTCREEGGPCLGKTQVIWVEDLAACLAEAVTGGRTAPGPQELAGPESMCVLAFWDAAVQAGGRGGWLRLHVPETFLRLGGLALARASGAADFLRLAEFCLASTSAEDNLAPVLLGRPLVGVEEGLARLARGKSG